VKLDILILDGGFLLYGDQRLSFIQLESHVKSSLSLSGGLRRQVISDIFSSSVWDEAIRIL
jgi:hypothetical protein